MQRHDERRGTLAASAATEHRPTLTLYITEHCFACEHALELVERVRRDYPRVRVEVRDLDHPGAPESVFAAPTFLLNDALLSLGTPEWDALASGLDRALSDAPPAPRGGIPGPGSTAPPHPGPPDAAPTGAPHDRHDRG